MKKNVFPTDSLHSAMELRLVFCGHDIPSIAAQTHPFWWNFSGTFQL